MRTVGLLVVTVVLVEYLAVPRLVQATSDLDMFADAFWPLLVVALAVEMASLAAYTALTRAVLTPGVRPSFVDQLRMDLTGFGVSHVVPGGGASAAALRFRLMTERGVPPVEAASAAAVQGAVAVIGLVATFAGGVVLAGPGIAAHPWYVWGGLLALLALLLLAGAFHRVAGRPAPRHVRGRPARRELVSTRGGRAAVAVDRGVRTVASAARTATVRTAELARDPRAGIRVFAWSTLNWLLDAASLWLCLWAYGIVIHPGALLTAYGAANLVGLLPITPGGLGLVEGVLIPAVITLADAPAAAVTLGVLTWRLLQFWLPIPVAGVAYVSLRLHRPGRLPPLG